MCERDLQGLCAQGISRGEVSRTRGENGEVIAHVYEGVAEVVTHV